MYNQMPELTGVKADKPLLPAGDRIHALRDDVQKALELSRKEKVIGKSLEASVTLYCGGELYDFVKSVEEELKTVFIVSRVDVVKGGEAPFRGEVEGFSVTVGKAGGRKM